MTVVWTECGCFLSFAFLGGARRMGLCPCYTCHPWLSRLRTTTSAAFSADLAQPKPSARCGPHVTRRLKRGREPAYPAAQDRMVITRQSCRSAISCPSENCRVYIVVTKEHSIHSGYKKMKGRSIAYIVVQSEVIYNDSDPSGTTRFWLLSAFPNLVRM